MKRWVSNLLIVVFAAVFLISAYLLIDYFAESRHRQDEFDSLADLVEQAQQEQTRPSAEPDSTETATEPTEPALVQVTDPETGETVEVLKEYAQLYTMNNHIVGWMKLEGTKLNYPVMQTPDSTDYYLHKGFDRTYSAHGCLYAREACDIAASDNVTVYGHNMKDGSMFSPLFKYEKRSFWEQNQHITFDSLTEHRTYQVMAVFYTTASEGEGFAYHLFEDAADEAEFDDYVNTCKRLAIYDTGVTAAYGDQLITLSTCEYSRVNGRLVVVAKKVNA